VRPLIVISHTYVERANRGKLRALARSGRVTAVVPSRWRERALGRTWRTPATETDGGVTVVPARWLGPHRPSVGVLLTAGSLLSDPTAVVQIEEEPWTPSAWLAARRARGPVFLFTWENLERRLPPPLASIRRSVLGRVRGVIAGNTAAADVVRAAGFGGPVTVIPQLGVPLVPATPRSTADALRIGYVGRLVPEKGVDLLLRAVARLEARWTLTVVGDGPARPGLERLAAELGLGPDRLRFEGARPHGAVAELWAGLDVLVLPSRTTPRWKEQLGHVLLEAMAHGVAVVGASSGAIPEVIGTAGIVFPEDDHAALGRALAGLAADRARVPALGAAGRDRARTTYADDVLAARTRAFHDAVMSAG
jgi:glycosyltransferase involved in cell wall biosynthesis